jgi:hypothetical protein
VRRLLDGVVVRIDTLDQEGECYSIALRHMIISHVTRQCMDKGLKAKFTFIHLNYVARGLIRYRGSVFVLYFSVGYSYWDKERP